jgi:murein L,D-transpeptidase YcbB/YkuD
MGLSKWAQKSLFLVGAAMLLPQMALAFGEASVLQNYVGRQSEVPMIKPEWGNFIIHTDRLNKIYSIRNYSPIWTDSRGLPTQMATSLKALLKAADTHGLNPSEYWDADVETLYNATIRRQDNWITFEMAATEALIRYASHLENGRFEPNLVDTDIKYKMREFTEYDLINNALSAGPAGLAAAMEVFAPRTERYQDLKDALVQLKSVRSQGGWAALKTTGVKLKLGVNSPLVGQLRARLNQMGYPVSMAGGNLFDKEFDVALRNFQGLNGITVDGEIRGTQDSEVLRVLNYSVAARLSQVEMTMEKLRWLPRQMESSYIFVNLATTDFRLYADTNEVFFFKTINGQPFRRTPSMKDSITYVDMNPTWTVPRNIAIKDKLPLLKQDAGYLEKHNMRLIDVSTERTVNARSIDWQTMTPRNFTYTIQQLAGPNNALGVVKFPLQNPWSIYMHDTNEKELFEKNDRHFSSGCVRLEQPLELAAYLLRDQPEWSLNNIKAFVPMSKNEEARETSRKVSLTKPMPVYFIYLTVEKTKEGYLRFVDDVYGQDYRLAKSIQGRRSSAELF